MSYLLDHLSFLNRSRASFQTAMVKRRDDSRSWEDGYRQRWQHDKIVRSTHGVNCTGSC